MAQVKTLPTTYASPARPKSDTRIVGTPAPLAHTLLMCGVPHMRRELLTNQSSPRAIAPRQNGMV